MMATVAADRVGTAERVLVAIVGPAPAEAALRDAFDEAERGGASVRVVAAGPAPELYDDVLRDLAERWAEKYPGVPVSTHIRRQVDAAVTLVAATRHCAAAFAAGSSDPAAAAVLRALIRRAHCPVVVIGERPEP